MVGITAVFMGVDPSTLPANLAGTIRALNEYLPAHTDPDGSWPVTNLYVRSVEAGEQECEGCDLFVADGKLGGQVVKVKTELSKSNGSCHPSGLHAKSLTALGGVVSGL